MSDKPRHNVSSLQSRNEEIAKSAEPHLERGEDVREIFMGQSLLSPIWYLVPVFWIYIPLASLLGLIVPPLSFLAPQKRLILVTDRNIYMCSKQRGRFGVKKVLDKMRLGEVGAELGFTWSLKVGESPRLYASELGIRGEREKVATLVNEAGAAT